MSQKIYAMTAHHIKGNANISVMSAAKKLADYRNVAEIHVFRAHDRWEPSNKRLILITGSFSGPFGTIYEYITDTGLGHRRNNYNLEYVNRIVIENGTAISVVNDIGMTGNFPLKVFK